MRDIRKNHEQKLAAVPRMPPQPSRCRKKYPWDDHVDNGQKQPIAHVLPSGTQATLCLKQSHFPRGLLGPLTAGTIAHAHPAQESHSRPGQTFQHCGGEADGPTLPSLSTGRKRIAVRKGDTELISCKHPHQQLLAVVVTS